MNTHIEKALDTLQKIIDWRPVTDKALHDPEEDKKRKIAQRIHNSSLHLGAQCKVTKDKSGNYRWTMITSSSFKDQEGEIVSLQALKDDVARTDKGDDPGPARFWHIGTPDIATRSPGPGLDIGDVDFRAVHGKSLIESGLFTDKAIGEAFSKTDNLAASIAFFHPVDQPDKDGVYHNIHSFERSFLPEGKQANLLSTQPIREKDKDMDKSKMDAFAKIVGEDAAKAFLGDVEKKEEAADAAGITSKESGQIDMAELAKAFAALIPDVVGPMIDEKIKLAMADPNDAEAAVIKAAKEQADKEKALTDKMDTLATGVAEIATQVKELLGEQPRGSQGYRPTQDQSTLISDKVVEAGSQQSPLDAFTSFVVSGDNGRDGK